MKNRRIIVIRESDIQDHAFESLKRFLTEEELMMIQKRLNELIITRTGILSSLVKQL